MKAYRYGKIIIPENKLKVKLNKYGITMEDLIPIGERVQMPPTAEEEYPYTYRINCNTILCAYNKEDLEKLKLSYDRRTKSNA